MSYSQSQIEVSISFTFDFIGLVEVPVIFIYFLFEVGPESALKFPSQELSEGPKWALYKERSYFCSEIEGILLNDVEEYIPAATEPVCKQSNDICEIRIGNNNSKIRRHRGGAFEEEIDSDPSTIISIAIRNAEWQNAEQPNGKMAL